MGKEKDWKKLDASAQELDRSSDLRLGDKSGDVSGLDISSQHRPKSGTTGPSGLKKLMGPKPEPEYKEPRTVMDPQSRLCLDEDL